MHTTMRYNKVRNELKPEIKEVAKKVVQEIKARTPKVATAIFEDEEENQKAIQQLFLEEVIEFLVRKA